MPKIAMIGAGSFVFARRLTADILSWPELHDSELVFVDVEVERAELAKAVADRLIGDQKLPARTSATTDRRQALDGADYVIVMIQVGGIDAVRPDLEIPLKYGVDQAVGDTLGPGGVFRFLRTGPTIIDICRDMEELCPRALLINYSNPMAMICWSVAQATKIRSVGFCHSVQGTSARLAKYAGIPYEDVSYWVAGINHMAWFLKFDLNGQDARPRLFEAMEDPEIYKQDPVRFEVMRQLGYFVTESTNHMSEYIPWVRKRPELIKEMGLRSVKEGHMQNWEARRAEYRDQMRRQAAGDEPIEGGRTNEYCSYVIHSEVTNTPFRVNGNVRNDRLITNLPEGCCVEVPCLVDRTGINPCHVGDLPPQLAALNRTNINVQELAVRAMLEGNRDYARQAVQLDPLTAAVCTLPEIKQMTDQLFEASGPWLRM
jgi:alpha-galactosidase